MLSPDAFFEKKLKGKSAEEIQTIIRGLKNKIGHLKAVLEDPEENFEPMMTQTLVRQIEYNRLYLARAKQALSDAGEEYKPSQREKRIQSFDESIPFIERIEFTYYGFSEGHETRTITFKGEDLILEVSSFLLVAKDRESLVRKFPGIKKDFLEALASLHIGEWKKRYNNCMVLDGYSWNLDIHFCHGHRAVSKGGFNDYPYNFDAFYRLINGEDGEIEKD